jgi:hypothetical protein
VAAKNVVSKFNLKRRIAHRRNNVGGGGIIIESSSARRNMAQCRQPALAAKAEMAAA